MNISAKQVADLRAKTGCGMMECKKALVEANGDFDEAVKLLRERGLAVSAKKADRIASEGIVDIMTDEAKGLTAIIEVNSETDFVGKNASFQEFVRGLLTIIINEKPADVAELLTLKYLDTDFTVDGKIKDMIFTIGENMNIRRFEIIEGTVSTYIHGKGSIGVIIKFEADDAAKNNAGFAEFAKNIALQVAAFPVAYLDKESVPASVIEEEKNILLAQIKNDPKNANKPENIVAKMVEGKIGKYYESNCLLHQSYVKDDSLTVGKYVEATAKEFGAAIKVIGFTRFEKGEGLQKREDDLADEVAKLISK